MVGHEPRVPGVEGGGAAGGLDSEAGSEDSQEQEPGQEHGHGQHGALGTTGSYLQSLLSLSFSENNACI